MKQIKIFHDHDSKRLEDEVNNFIEDKTIIGIAYKSYPVKKTDYKTVLCDAVMVIYEEKE